MAANIAAHPSTLTASQLRSYVQSHHDYPPAPGEPGAWLEHCAWCDEPAVATDGAPDRGHVYCSAECREEARRPVVRITPCCGALVLWCRPFQCVHEWDGRVAARG